VNDGVAYWISKASEQQTELMRVDLVHQQQQQQQQQQQGTLINITDDL